MSRLNLWILALACAIMAGMSSCGSGGNTGYLYQTAADAHDHIMLVRESPPTFGYERLRALSQYYPHLGVFIQSQGEPRYYAETKSGGGSYLVLYYPETRQAFACRMGSKLSHQIEFSGPYPITKNEMATLQMLEDD